MGQIIDVKLNHIGKQVILDLNRSISSQEGVSFSNIAEASLDRTFCGDLALQLFQRFEEINSIYIQSNVITLSFTHNLGTDIQHIKELVSQFFIFYQDTGEEE
tara:strand:- start:341 stop:649 length:309 start_codon:yes stop_codon:yes gene_type:complete